jgi:hypothetical protein
VRNVIALMQEYQWLEGLEEQARLVEHDNSKDE